QSSFNNGGLLTAIGNPAAVEFSEVSADLASNPSWRRQGLPSSYYRGQLPDVADRTVYGQTASSCLSKSESRSKIAIICIECEFLNRRTLCGNSSGGETYTGTVSSASASSTSNI